MGSAAALLPFLGATLGSELGPQIAGGLNKVLPGGGPQPIMGPPAPINLLSPETIKADLAAGGQINPGINLATNSNFVPVGSQAGPGPATLSPGFTPGRGPESFATAGNILGGLGGAGAGLGAAALLGGTQGQGPPPIPKSSVPTGQRLGPIGAPNFNFNTISAGRGAIGLSEQQLLDMFRKRGLV